MAYTVTTPQLGVSNISDVTTYAPSIANLPGVVLQPKLGEIVEANDYTLGGGKFIYLAVPVSTAVQIGLIVVWDGSWVISSAPTSGTNSARPCAVAVNTVTSNSTEVQYTWFQIQGNTSVLKTAVAVSPMVPLYISGTAGRAYVTASAGKQVTGLRTTNTATVASGTSLVGVNIEFPLWGGN